MLEMSNSWGSWKIFILKQPSVMYCYRQRWLIALEKVRIRKSLWFFGLSLKLYNNKAVTGEIDYFISVI